MARKYDDRLEEHVYDLAVDPNREPPPGLSEADLKHWRKMRAQVRTIKRRGAGIETPHDIPG